MADSSADGVINYSEFMMTAVDREKFLTIERLEALFNEMDVDGNNKVSLEELNYFLGQSEHMDHEALKAAFESVDPEGVGEISFGQFKVLINELLE
jgi:calcium-dependent protein kinase